MSSNLYFYRAQIFNIYDADTVRLSIDLGFGISHGLDHGLPMRLVGIDAPELGTAKGKVARDRLRAILPVGTDVIIKTDKDKTEKYGRYLATLFTINTTNFEWASSVNYRLIAEGYARPYDGGTR